jgi:hypothetical protein
LPHQMRHVLLPARRLRVTRREVKQVYSKHTPVAGGMCLPPNPLSHMSSFWTLSRCLIRWLPFLLRRPLSEMYWPKGCPYTRPGQRRVGAAFRLPGASLMTLPNMIRDVAPEK